jgi:hypothetical protein
MLYIPGRGIFEERLISTLPPSTHPDLEIRVFSSIGVMDMTQIPSTKSTLHLQDYRR